LVEECKKRQPWNSLDKKKKKEAGNSGWGVQKGTHENKKEGRSSEGINGRKPEVCISGVKKKYLDDGNY